MNNKPTIIAFNTGRAYTQRIAAVLLNDGSTLFVDVDRGVEGRINIDHPLDSATLMNDYDNGRYHVPDERNTGLNYNDLRALCDRLRAAARAVPASIG